MNIGLPSMLFSWAFSLVFISLCFAFFSSPLTKEERAGGLECAALRTGTRTNGLNVADAAVRQASHGTGYGLFYYMEAEGGGVGTGEWRPAAQMEMLHGGGGGEADWQGQERKYTPVDSTHESLTQQASRGPDAWHDSGVRTDSATGSYGAPPYTPRSATL